MVQFRPQAREIIAKVVYYGPPLGGKTTNLRTLYRGYPPETRGELVIVPTGTDRTIFFDFLPVNAGSLRGMSLRMQLYTVPGQVHFNTTRQVVLRGVDGVVFVADSQREMLSANASSWENLKENLLLQGIALADIPHVLQYNKRDLPEIYTLEELNDALNEYNAPFYDAVATEGIGVEETLHGVVRLVARSLRERFKLAPEGPGTRDNVFIGPRLARPVIARETGEARPAAASVTRSSDVFSEFASLPDSGVTRPVSVTGLQVERPAERPADSAFNVPPRAEASPAQAPPDEPRDEVEEEPPFEAAPAPPEAFAGDQVVVDVDLSDGRDTPFGEEAADAEAPAPTGEGGEESAEAEAAEEAASESVPEPDGQAQVVTRAAPATAEPWVAPLAGPGSADYGVSFVPAAARAAFDPFEPQRTYVEAASSAGDPFGPSPSGVVAPPMAPGGEDLDDPFGSAELDAAAGAGDVFAGDEPPREEETALVAAEEASEMDAPVVPEDTLEAPAAAAWHDAGEALPEPPPGESDTFPEPPAEEPEAFSETPTEEPEPPDAGPLSPVGLEVVVEQPEAEAAGDDEAAEEAAPAADPDVMGGGPAAAEAAIQRVLPRALAQFGEVRELEVEVPVPTAWLGGRRMTLQLRVTLVPEEEQHAG